MDLTVEPLGPDRKPKGDQIENSPRPPAMATIQDDDELLLARIGYKQVQPPGAIGTRDKKNNHLTLILSVGTTTRVLQMVHRLLRNLDSRGPRFRACDLRFPVSSRRPGNCSMVLVNRFLHGHVHWKLGSRVSLRLSDSRGNVFRHQTCRAARSGPDLLLDPGLV